jgi:hypothetical protein
MILDYSKFLNEGSKKDSLLSYKFTEESFPEGSKEAKSFQKFSQNRLEGATKISSGAKEKGGDALLTYHHFRVKLPYYSDAAKGNFDAEDIEEKLENKISDLTKGLSGKLLITEVEFQKIMGEIEVLGELLLKFKSLQ